MTDEPEIRSIPYTTLSDNKVNYQVEYVMFIFGLLVDDGHKSKGFLDVHPMDEHGNHIPLYSYYFDKLIIGKRLEINVKEVDPNNRYMKENVINFTQWLNDIMLNSMMTEEYAIVEIKKFDADDEDLAYPVAELKWIIKDGKLTSVHPAG